MNDYSPVLQRLEAQDRAKTEEVRQMFYAEGRPDLVADFDRRVRDIETGITSARSAWHSISPAQQNTLIHMGNGAKLWRDPMNPRAYFLRLRSSYVVRVRIATVRALAARELLAWDGDAFDPEAKAVLTERGRFVLKHRLPDGEKFTG